MSGPRSGEPRLVMHAVQRGGNVVDGWEREIVLFARWAAARKGFWQSRHGDKKVDSLWAYLVVLAFVRLMFPFSVNHSNQSQDHTYKGP